MKLGEYRFEDVPSHDPNHYRKNFYIGTKLYGIGSADTLRKAKINCAKDAI